MANVSMADIGDKLRQAREKRSLTVDQAQKQTHIHSRIISALEDGKCDEILNQTYVKSFLKTYSRYLGLDSKEIADGYESAHPEAGRPNVNLSKEGPKRSFNISKLFYAAMVFSVIAAMIFLGIFIWNKTAASLAKARSGKKAAISRSGSNAPGKKQAVQKKSLKIADLKLKEVSRSESLSGRKQYGQTPIPKNMPFNLAIKVKAPVLIELKKDGVLLFKRVLPKDTVESFRANESVNIFVAKSEAIEIIVNGKAVDLPTRGVIKNLEITRKGIRIR